MELHLRSAAYGPRPALEKAVSLFNLYRTWPRV
jgi:hypothetical protein